MPIEIDQSACSYSVLSRGAPVLVHMLFAVVAPAAGLGEDFVVFRPTGFEMRDMSSPKAWIHHV